MEQCFTHARNLLRDCPFLARLMTRGSYGSYIPDDKHIDSVSYVLMSGSDCCIEMLANGDCNVQTRGKWRKFSADDRWRVLLHICADMPSRKVRC